MSKYSLHVNSSKKAGLAQQLRPAESPAPVSAQARLSGCCPTSLAVLLEGRKKLGENLSWDPGFFLPSCCGPDLAEHRLGATSPWSSQAPGPHSVTDGMHTPSEVQPSMAGPKQRPRITPAQAPPRGKGHPGTAPAPSRAFWQHCRDRCSREPGQPLAWTG